MNVAITIILINALLLSTEHQTGEWKKSLDKDDIIIYTREVQDSPFLEFRAEAEMQGSLKHFKEIITDFEKYPEIIPDCKTVTVIETPSPDEYIYHMELKVPFPFAQRDVVQHLIVEESPEKLIVLLKNLPERLETAEQVVRIQKAYGSWKVKEISADKIFIEFQYLADPGGGIPPWLVNSFIVKSPFKTLKSMRKEMQQ